jgi:hypothetical protein
VEREEREGPGEAIRQRLESLRGRDLTDAEIEVEARGILAAGPAAIPVLLEQFTVGDETLLAVATQALKSWDEPRPVEALLGLIRNPRVDALAKALVLAILERYGLDVKDPHLLGLGINLEEYPWGAGAGEDTDEDDGQ